MNIFDKLFGIKDAADGIMAMAGGIKTLITGKLPPDKEAEILVKIAEIESQANKMQSDINLIDAQSQDKFQSRWRPAIGWVCVFGLSMQYIILPIVGLFMTVPPLNFSELITLLFALLGMSSLRTIDKKYGTSS